MESSNQSVQISSVNISVSKPLSDIPSTIGTAIDIRNRVEKRVLSTLQQFKTKNPFWSVGEKPENAMRQIQTVLDRMQVLFEVNEIITFATANKNSNVKILETELSLGQLRDAKTWFVPHCILLISNITRQIRSVNDLCKQHDQRVESDLANEIANLERDHKLKKDIAKQYGEPEPSSASLDAEIATVTRRAESKKSVKIDPIEVNKFLSILNKNVGLFSGRSEDAIDRCNAESISSEISKLQSLRKTANEKINECQTEEITLDINPDENNDGKIQKITLQELTRLTTELNNSITDAIKSTIFVSYQKGKKAKIENPEVKFAEEGVDVILKNMRILMEYRKVHRIALCSSMFVKEPLTQTPCSIDALIRLGYEDDENDTNERKIRPHISRKSGNRKRFNNLSADTSSEDTINDISLFSVLTQLNTRLKNAPGELKNEKEAYESRIKSSISEKLDSRSKSGAQLKGSELEEIVKAVKTSDNKEFFLSDNIQEATTKIQNLIEQVQTLQSAHRKSANARTIVKVPIFHPMEWIEASESVWASVEASERKGGLSEWQDQSFTLQE